MTRRDEERKRNKLVSKPKRQKIHKLAKHKSKLHNRKDSKEKHKSDTSSSDEGEEKRYETQEIPYIEQYRYKKKMDNKLNDEHYWSGPGEERNRLNRTEVREQIYIRLHNMFNQLIIF